MSDKYAVHYTPISTIPDRFMSPVYYSIVSKLYSLLDTPSLEEMGVAKLQKIPSLSLKGNGVLLGIIDTGIDYRNPLFQNADQTTRILSIWDQSIENMQASSEIFYYGVPDHVVCFSESDIMFGLTYLINTAKKMNRPIAQ